MRSVCPGSEAWENQVSVSSCCDYPLPVCGPRVEIHLSWTLCPGDILTTGHIAKGHIVQRTFVQRTFVQRTFVQETHLSRKTFVTLQGGGWSQIRQRGHERGFLSTRLKQSDCAHNRHARVFNYGGGGVGAVFFIRKLSSFKSQKKSKSLQVIRLRRMERLQQRLSVDYQTLLWGILIQKIRLCMPWNIVHLFSTSIKWPFIGQRG